MSHNPDVNKSFSQLAVLILGGGLIASFTSGSAGMVGALIICYFMLVATNAIRRGEELQKRKGGK